jgi:hypothetical protein
MAVGLDKYRYTKRRVDDRIIITSVIHLTYFNKKLGTSAKWRNLYEDR